MRDFVQGLMAEWQLDALVYPHETRPVRTIAEGGVYMTPSLGELLVRGLSRDPEHSSHEALSDREFEVLRHVISGSLNKQIGYQLAISEKTVKIHRGRVMDKLGVESLADLVRLAAQAGIDTLD